MATEREVAVAVVVPVFGNADSLVELHRRLVTTLASYGDDLRLVFVDDACPRGSSAVLAELAAGDRRVVVCTHATNQGQHRAVLTGLAAVAAQRYVVLDGDLQDPPEAVSTLLAKLTDAAIVFAIRRGAYEDRRRLVESRLFRWLLAQLGGVPEGGSLFVALTRQARDRLLAQVIEPPYVVVLLAGLDLPMSTLVVERGARPHGVSAYSSRSRIAIAGRAIAQALQLRLGLAQRRPFVTPTLRGPAAP